MRSYCLVANFILPLLVLTACGGSSDGPQPMDPAAYGGTDEVYGAREIAEQLNEPLVQCPERVWPGLGQSYHNAQILITDDSSAEPEAYLWQEQSTEIETLDATQLADVWFAGFAFSEYRGRRTLGFNINDWNTSRSRNPESLRETPINILYHESFHLFADEGWAVTRSDRYGEYPLRWQPRYLRAKLMQSLENALLESEGPVEYEDLAAASYWYERYLAEHSDEAVRITQTDRSEGAAQYAEHFMMAITELGCGASEAELLARAQEHMSSTRYRDNPGAESYVLGALAGALLRERGPEGWEMRVEQGETFQGILLEGIAPESQPEDEELRQQIQSGFEDRNQELEGKIAGSLARWHGEGYHRLVIDNVRSIGSYTKDDHLRLVDEPMLKGITLKHDGDYDHGATIALNRVDTFEIDGYPCGTGFGRPTLALVPDSDITLKTDGTADSSNGLVQFSGLEVETVVWQELEWLCPLE